MAKAKSAFKELLQETKKITDKSLSMVKEKDSGHMSEIIELLSKDKRYLDLESVQGKFELQKCFKYWKLNVWVKTI